MLAPIKACVKYPCWLTLKKTSFERSKSNYRFLLHMLNVFRGYGLAFSGNKILFRGNFLYIFPIQCHVWGSVGLQIIFVEFIFTFFFFLHNPRSISSRRRPCVIVHYCSATGLVLLVGLFVVGCSVCCRCDPV